MFLGLFPAWGGTQLAPRLMGAEAAVKLIVDNPLRQNRLIGASEALELGLVDHVLEPVEFLDESLELLLRRVEAGEGKRVLDADLSDAAEVVRKARSRVDDVVHGQAPAPYRALDLIAGAATWTIEEGYAAEEDALAELLPGPEAQAAIYAFDVVERRIEAPAKDVPDCRAAQDPARRLVGAGLMATQLATLFVRRLEVPVVLTDVDPGRAAQAVESIRGELARARREGTAPRGQGALPRLDRRRGRRDGVVCRLRPRPRGGIRGARREARGVRRARGGRLAGVPARDEHVRVLGDRDGRGAAAPGAGRRPPLLQPGRGAPARRGRARRRRPTTTTLATAWDVTKRLGKRGVLVRDAPAFVVNRMLTRQSTVLMQAVESGNTFEETDEAALRLGIPMPPSALLAMVGPRVANHVLETLHARVSRPVPALADAAGARRRRVPRDRGEGRPRRASTSSTSAILEALADEARHILDEGVVRSAAEIDACLILGAGYPSSAAGITKHLDQRASPATGVSGRSLARPAAGQATLAAAVAVARRPRDGSGSTRRACSDARARQTDARVALPLLSTG